MIHHFVLADVSVEDLVIFRITLLVPNVQVQLFQESLCKLRILQLIHEHGRRILVDLFHLNLKFISSQRENLYLINFAWRNSRMI